MKTESKTEPSLKKFTIEVEFDDEVGVWGASALGWSIDGYSTIGEAIDALFSSIQNAMGHYK